MKKKKINSNNLLLLITIVLFLMHCESIFIRSAMRVKKMTVMLKIEPYRTDGWNFIEM